MKAVAELVVADAGHIDVIARHARQADIDELWACARTTPAEAMARGLAGSAEAWTAVVRGTPVCMFGATPYSILGGIGTPWMVGSTGLNPFAVQKELLRLSRPALGRMQHAFPSMLFNVVDQRNTAALRWLSWLGFHFLAPVPVGRDSTPFIPFYWST